MSNPLRAIARTVLPQRMKSRLRIIPWRLLNLHWNLPSGLVARIRTRSDWIVYNCIFVNREYDTVITEALAATPPDRPFRYLDLGGNVGFFTLRVAELVRASEHPNRAVQGLVVEGSPRNYADLKARLAEQPGGLPGVRAVNGLVGRRQGSARITESDMSGMNEVVLGKSRGEPDTEAHFVDLESLCAEFPTIDLLKCDIEGSELEFLRHYPELMKRVRAAVFELHPGLCDGAECRRRIRDAGLDRYQLLWDYSETTVDWFRRA